MTYPRDLVGFGGFYLVLIEQCYLVSFDLNWVRHYARNGRSNNEVLRAFMPCFPGVFSIVNLHFSKL